MEYEPITYGTAASTPHGRQEVKSCLWLGLIRRIGPIGPIGQVNGAQALSPMPHYPAEDLLLPVLDYEAAGAVNTSATFEPEATSQTEMRPVQLPASTNAPCAPNLAE